MWNEAKDKFEEQLERYAYDALRSGSLSVNARKQKNTLVIKGKQFLASVSELKNLGSERDEYFYATMLSVAAQLLQNRSKNNYAQFCGWNDRLQQEMASKASENFITGSVNIAISSLYVTAGVSGIFFSTLVINDAFVALTVGTTVSLAAGPWGLLALGVGIALLGVVIATIHAHSVYENYRLCQGQQLEDINDFVAFLNPEPQVNASCANNAESYAFPQAFAPAFQ